MAETKEQKLRKLYGETDLTEVQRAETAVTDAELALDKARQTLADYEEQLTNGTKQVPIAKFAEAQVKITHAQLALQGEHAKLARARQGDRTAQLSAIRAEIEDYADTNEHLTRATEAVTALIAAHRALVDSVSAHNEAVGSLSARVAALGVDRSVSVGLAVPQASDGSCGFHNGALVGGAVALRAVNVDAVINQALSTEEATLTGCETREVDTALVWFRRADGTSVSFRPEDVPGPVQTHLKGLTRIEVAA